MSAFSALSGRTVTNSSSPRRTDAYRTSAARWHSFRMQSCERSPAIMLSERTSVFSPLASSSTLRATNDFRSSRGCNQWNQRSSQGSTSRSWCRNGRSSSRAPATGSRILRSCCSATFTRVSRPSRSGMAGRSRLVPSSSTPTESTSGRTIRIAQDFAMYQSSAIRSSSSHGARCLAHTTGLSLLAVSSWTFGGSVRATWFPFHSHPRGKTNRTFAS